MYIWTFFCLLLKQVIESRDKDEFRSAIDVILKQINLFQSTMETAQTNNDINSDTGVFKDVV